MSASTLKNGSSKWNNPRSTPHAVVCFSGARDNYQTAWALSEAGLLEKLVTDIYADPHRIPLARTLGKKFPKLLVRHSPGVPTEQVVTPMQAAVSSLIMKTRLGSEARQIHLDQTLGRRARQEAWRANAALFSYSYYAAEGFAPGPMRPEFRFLFQLHPHPKTIRKLLREELERVPKFAASLRWEHELAAPESHFTALCSEPSLANGWVTASSYTAQTLTENGVPRDQIHVVPYGVDATQYPCRETAPRDTDPFRVVWVGNMTQRKGLSYFLEAIASLPRENLEVLVCGHHAVERGVIEGCGIKSIRVLRGLPTCELTQLMRSCDLFVLPSLAEGFGHVILEAMSSGLPVLTTGSTCAPDVLVDGKHGFIVPIRNSEALAAKISWGRAHRGELHQMGLAAAARARLFTWERFRHGIVSAYAKMAEHQASFKNSPEPVLVSVS
jgi:glycosyltransferase involved in cell wall biosynthesis